MFINLTDIYMSWDSSVGIFVLAMACRPTLGSTQLRIQWVKRAHSIGVKRLGREADRSVPTNADVK